MTNTSPIKSVLVDQRNVDELMPKILAELKASELFGFDIETQDRNRHAGLNSYNNEKRHVFDHRRTVITGFSTYCDGSDTAYYFNMAHADVENRLWPEFGMQLIDEFNPDAICVCHNASFELVMVEQCWKKRLQGIVCTLQLAVSHHSSDEYDLKDFYETPLPHQFVKLAPDIIRAFAGWEGGTMDSEQQELLGKFIGKTSKAEHSYNGYFKSIAKGYNLKRLTKSRFGYEQKEFKALLKEFGAEDMGDLTGEQVCAYGADDAYWAVQHYKWMLADMLRTNPAALNAFFRTENPMVHIYAETWRDGLRLDLDQVFERQRLERIAYAEVIRSFKAKIKAALPFPAEMNEKLAEKEARYAKSWQKKRDDIVRWANSPDCEDDFEQCYQVSNPIGNAWAIEVGKVPPKNRLNVVYWETMRTIIYDLLGAKLVIAEGKVQSDADARGRIRERFEKQGNDKAFAIMVDYQQMADIEQRMKLYLTPYTQLMDPETHRVYPSLSSALATRRLAASFPNPMQLAKQGESKYIRGFYLGDEDGDLVISADWSSVELVLIGDMSGDDGFRKVFGQLPYGDLHSGAAVDCLAVKTLPGLTEDEFREFKFNRNPNNRVLKNFSGTILEPKAYHKFMRGTPVGKGANFNYWYSGSLATVGGNLNWTDDEMWEAVERYRTRFPDGEAWRIALQQEAVDRGFITLPDGHIRSRFEATWEWSKAMKQKFADISHSPGFLNYADVAIRRLQSRAKNQAVNAMIQGTCATLAKRSILNLRKLLDEAGISYAYEWNDLGLIKPDVRFMLPIHDELVFNCRPHVAMAFIPLLRRAMTEHKEIVKEFPLNVSVALGLTFKPFDQKNPAFSQIELDEASPIAGITDGDLEGTKLSDDKVAEVLDFIRMAA